MDSAPGTKVNASVTLARHVSELRRETEAQLCVGTGTGLLQRSEDSSVLGKRGGKKASEQASETAW